jgi:tetratricopeptide (TPR) repeat protein
MTFASARAAAQRRHRSLLAALVALAVFAYGAALAGDCVFDDVHSVVGNPSLHGDVDWWKLCSDPSAFSAGSSRMFRPVLLLSLAGNLALSPTVAALKAGNVLLHVLVAALAFSWLRRLHVGALAAFAGAAVFAVHPLLSEAVNLVSARSELLLVLGLLVGLRCQLAWLRGGQRALGVFGMVGGALLACGSKETGVVLPALLLAQGWSVRRERWRVSHWGRAVSGVLPVIALVVVYLVLRKVLLGQATVSLLGRAGEDPTSGHGRTLVTQLATMGLLLPRALLQMVWPTGLSMDPPVSFRHTFGDPFVLAGWGGVLGLTVAGLWRGRGARVRRLGVALAWATALPWVVVPLNMPLAEHRLYGPLLGVVVALAPWLGRLPRRLPRGTGPWLRPAFAAGLAVFALLAAQRSLDFRDERRLWQVELAARPLSWRAWWGLGTANLRAGDTEPAIEQLARAHDLYPGHFDVLRNYAEALTRLPPERAQPFRALAVAGMLHDRAPRDPWARTLLADAHLQTGRATGDPSWFHSAETIALSCLDVAPPKALVYRMAATARRGAGDLPGALQHLDTSLARGLAPIALRLERVALLRELGRPDEARRELLRAQQQAPLDPNVQQALRTAAQPPR